MHNSELMSVLAVCVLSCFGWAQLPSNWNCKFYTWKISSFIHEDIKTVVLWDYEYLVEGVERIRRANDTQQSHILWVTLAARTLFWEQKLSFSTFLLLTRLPVFSCKKASTAETRGVRRREKKEKKSGENNFFHFFSFSPHLRSSQWTKVFACCVKMANKSKSDIYIVNFSPSNLWIVREGFKQFLYTHEKCREQKWGETMHEITWFR